jgi:hypothetical protein
MIDKPVSPLRQRNVRAVIPSLASFAMECRFGAPRLSYPPLSPRRSRNRCTLPLGVFGSSLMNSISRG